MPSFALSHIGALALVASVILVAFLVNRFKPRKRKLVRRMVIPLLLYFAAVGVSAVLPRLGLEAARNEVLAVSELFAVFTAINIVAILLFDLALPALKIEIATLITDIAVGLAYIAAVLGGMRRYGVELSGIIATSAVVTAILALSLQATLGNILGGVALQVDKSVRVGDWIQLENGRQGRVREIRWRHTVIETRDWDTLVVPNATLLSATIVILGKREGEPQKRRMWIHFNVDFRYSPVDVIEAVEKALRGSPIEGVAQDPPPNCVCLDFAKEGRDSFGYYALRYWLTDLARDDLVNSNVRVRLFAALRRARIPLAVPAAQIFVEQDDPERRERKHRREIEKRTRALREVEIFQPLTDEELAKLAESLSFAPFSKGETITKQGSVAHYLYILTGGAVEVRVAVPGTLNEKGNGPEERVVALLQAPSFFGEMGLMTGEPRTATIVAVADVESYRLDREVFQKVVAERPEVASELSECLAERRVSLEAAMGEGSPGDRRTRVGMERNRLLASIQSFFGLGSGVDSRKLEKDP
jgi:small-conductance mechanosensitive channel/CRP-like cAMP-binding protein